MITHIRTCTRVGRHAIAPAVLLGAFLGLAVVADSWAQNLTEMVPDAARKAVARRQEQVAKSDEAVQRGQRLFADKDYAGAQTEFKKALDLLPDAPVVRARRDEYAALFADASVALARQRAEEGRYEEARTLIKQVLDPNVDPENPKARQLLADLDDPEIFSEAVTPQHIERVKQVEKALKTAEGHIRIGDYDGAEKKYHEALNFDPYNSGARRGLEEVERHRRLYYDTAYDHTRVKFLNEIGKQWESSVPRFAVDGGVGADRELAVKGSGVDYINEKLKRIQIPEIEFQDTPLSTAVDFLRQKARELDDLEPVPEKKGVNIIIRKGGAAAATTTGGEAGAADLGFGDAAAGGAAGAAGGAGEPPITLKLSNVPLVEALRYTTEQAGLKFKVDPNAVIIVPAGEAGGEMYTKVFRVPPSFLSAGGGGPVADGGGASGDPFAALDDKKPAGASALKPKKSPRAILEEVGVQWPAGSSVYYNAGNSQLVVHNSQAQLDIVEAYVESLKVEVVKQIYITTKFVEVGQDDDDTFGFDWTMGSLGIGDKMLMGGGTAGPRGADYDAADLPFGLFGDTNPLTAGLRSGQLAITGDSIDSVINAASVAAPTSLRSAPGILSVAGILTNPQFQAVLRAVSQHKGADLLSAPSIIAQSGKQAKVEVIREFIYPTEYDPPEIPDQVTAPQIQDGGGATGSIPVTPANPAAFETKNTGVTLDVSPTAGADGFTIDMDLTPEVVEFEGFINYGSPILDPNSGEQITPNIINMPVFAIRRVATSVTIWDGQTVAVGGLIREDVQHVQDKLPILGDVPFLGQFFRSESEVSMKRNLTIFVTVRVVDPAGAPVNENVSGAISPLDVGGGVGQPGSGTEG